ncbi:hypothetical protein BDZ97DRAFT_692670 [Flammula alnicola]|nr:hypothetical protein BDZ97DRAFT_692670 [Flammula alnicola]
MQHLIFEMKILSEKHQSGTDNFILQLKDEVNDILQHFWSTAHQMLSRREEADVQSIARVELALDNVVHSHSNGLSEHLNSLHLALASRFDSLLSGHEAGYQRLDQFLLTIQARWMELGTDFNEMKQSILQLSDQVAQTSESLQMSIRETRNIRVIQAEASVAASDLVKTLHHLTETANTELDKINGSAHLIGQHLKIQTQPASQHWKSWIMQLLELIYRADPGSFSYLERLFSFRLLLSILSFSWIVFRAVFSAVVTIFMILFFATRNIVVQKSARVLSSVLHS